MKAISKKSLAVLLSIVLVFSLFSCLGVSSFVANAGTTDAAPLADDRPVLTFSDFGIADGTYDVLHPNLAIIGSSYHGSIYGKTLAGTITAETGESGRTGFRMFGGANNPWQGLYFFRSCDGVFYLYGTTGELNSGIYIAENGGYNNIGTAVGLVPSRFGLENFDGALDFKMTFDAVDFDNDSNADDLKLGVFINNTLVNFGYMYLVDTVPTLGSDPSYLTIYNEYEGGKMTVQSVKKAFPTGLNELTLNDFFVNETKTLTVPANGSFGNLASREGNVPTLDHTYINLDVDFGGVACSERYIRWGNDWPGLSFKDLGNGTFRLHDAASGGVDQGILTSQIAGVNLTGAYNLKITTNYGDYDNGGQKNDVEVGLWFNDVLYNNQYFYFNNRASTMEAKLMVYSSNATDAPITVSDVAKTVATDQPIITPASFGIASGAQTSGNYTLAGQDTLLGSRLHMNVCLPHTAQNYLRIAGHDSEWHGLSIQPWMSAGTEMKANVFLDGDDASDAQWTFRDAVAGVDLYGDTYDFDITFDAVDLDGDGADDVRYGFFFNGVLYANHYYYVANAVPSIGNRFLVQCADNTNPIIIYNEPITPPTDLTVISLADFGNLPGGKLSADNDGTDPNNPNKGTKVGQLTTMDSVDGTLFNIDLCFGNTEGHQSFVRFAGAADSWLGLNIYPVAAQNGIGIQDVTGSNRINTVFTSAIARTELINNTFNLKISTKIMDTDGDGDADDVRFGFFFNDVLYADRYYDLTDYAACLGKYLLLYTDDTVNHPLTVTGYQTANYPEKNYCHLTVADFGITEVDGNETDGKLVGLDSLDETVLDLDWNFPNNANTFLRYGGVESAWLGLNIQPWCNDNRDMKIQLLYGSGAPLNGISWTLTKEIAGLELFDNTYRFSISTKFVDADNDGSKDDIRFGFFFNDVLYNNQHFEMIDGVQHLGTNIKFYTDDPVGAPWEVNTFVQREQLPTDFTVYSPADFGIADGTYTYNTTEDKYAFFTGQLTGVDSLDRAILSANINITADANFRYGGNQRDGWNGLCVMVRDGNLKIMDAGVATAENVKAFSLVCTPDVAGITLAESTFNLKLSTEYVAADGDGIKNDLKLGVWINNILYNDEYVILNDYVTEAKGDFGAPFIGLYLPSSAAILSISSDVESHSTEEHITSDVYYNLADGPYLLSGSSMKVNGVTKYNGNTLTVPGDYVITRIHNSVTYTQNVYLWQIGDAHADGVTDVRDLVALKKYIAGGTAATVAGKKGMDVNHDGSVDANDVALLKRAALGLAVIDTAADVPAVSYSNTVEDVMPIAGFYGPYDSVGGVDADGNSFTSSNTLTDDTYRLLSECGINLLTYHAQSYNATNAATVLKQLELAEKYGIDMYIHDDGLNGKTLSQIASRISSYNFYSSFKGISLADEPGVKNIYPTGKIADAFDDWRWLQGGSGSAYATVSNQLKPYSNMTSYINLLPCNAGLGTDEQYVSYLNWVAENTGVGMLSFDNYPFANASTTVKNCSNYLKNLRLVEAAASSHQMPFWSCIQAGGNWNDGVEWMPETKAYYPSGSEMKWNVNTSLAFGAKGITYFPAVQPYYFAFTEGGKMDYDRNALIGADGHPTEWYGYAKSINSWIASVDDILMNSTYQGMMATNGYYYTGYARTNLENAGVDLLNSYRGLTGVTASNQDNLIGANKYGAMVGCFDYCGRTALYVVNFDTLNTRSVTLNFDSAKSLTIMNQTTGMTTANASSCSVSLGAGEAALVLVG